MYWQLSSGNAFFWHCLHSTVVNKAVFPCAEFVQFTTMATGHLNMRVQVLHSVQVCMGRAGPSNSGSTPNCEKTPQPLRGADLFQKLFQKENFRVRLRGWICLWSWSGWLRAWTFKSMGSHRPRYPARHDSIRARHWYFMNISHLCPQLWQRHMPRTSRSPGSSSLP